jgi:hypothetical protein
MTNLVANVLRSVAKIVHVVTSTVIVHVVKVLSVTVLNVTSVIVQLHVVKVVSVTVRNVLSMTVQNVILATVLVSKVLMTTVATA